ncbi:recombinase family protein [Limimaricola soesokkakensis]|nr:recombinase family protein [Limimaricola soesokkakensis]
MSIPDQIRLCQRFARQRGWEVVREYSDEQQTSASNWRPDYQAMIADLHNGGFDILLAESIDRVTRDLEDNAYLYKHTKHLGVTIHTLGEGEMDAMKMTFRGLMGALFLEDLKNKTRRGLIGRVHNGRSAGGRSYGYRPALTPDGERGALDIVEDEAAVIRRIFREFAAGVSPLKIAAGLNRDGIPSPSAESKRGSSGHWKQNTINGNRSRGTGILNNDLYAGRRVWNRLRYSLDPVTRKRVSRLQPEDQWERADVPALRIVDQDLWEAVKSRQDNLTRRKGSDTAPKDRNSLSASQALRRRKYLLSGLLECGICGGKLTIAGSGPKKRYYCANAKEKGPAICSGMPGLLQHHAEQTVLSSLQDELMQDEAFQRFRTEFEKHMAASASSGQEELKLRDKHIREKEKVHRNLVKAVEQGDYSRVIIARLEVVDAELQTMRASRDAAAPVQIEMPNDLPALYRTYVDNLVQTLSGEQVAGRASDEMHELFERIVVRHDAKIGHTVELQGNLSSMLGAADSKNAASYAAAACSLKLVAGAGFEPATFRL